MSILFSRTPFCHGSVCYARPFAVEKSDHGCFGHVWLRAGNVGIVDVARLGGILPKTITAEPRIGNAPWRTVETSAGLLNAIGLDNDGVDAFLEHHLPYLKEIGTSVVVSVAGRTDDDFVRLAERVGSQSGVSVVELNLSCPNVSGGVDFGTNAESCRDVVAATRLRAEVPILAKLTPNVTRIVEIAQAAADGGADAVCLINTVLGIAIDWRRKNRCSAMAWAVSVDLL